MILSESQRNQLIAAKLLVCRDARGPLHWQGLASHSFRWLAFLGRLMITALFSKISVSVRVVRMICASCVAPLQAAAGARGGCRREGGGASCHRGPASCRGRRISEPAEAAPLGQPDQPRGRQVRPPLPLEPAEACAPTCRPGNGTSPGPSCIRFFVIVWICLEWSFGMVWNCV